MTFNDFTAKSCQKEVHKTKVFPMFYELFYMKTRHNLIFACILVYILCSEFLVLLNHKRDKEQRRKKKMKKRGTAWYTEKIDEYAYRFCDENNDFAYELYNSR